jgi:hypothetical protein
MNTNSPAIKSGMRGSGSIQEPDTYEESPGEESDQEAEGQHDIKEVIADHIHGPDENGHHHLNLTTLAQHMTKKKGLQDK